VSERTDLNEPLLLGATSLGGRLWRNNCGVAFHKNGSVVRYGVANPGGSDLIGLMPRVIRPQDVGRTVGVFAAVEAKTGRVPLTTEQSRFLGLIARLGGIAIEARDADAALAALARDP
jgi:hypothetical protein